MAYAAVVSLVQILKQSQQFPFLGPKPQIQLRSLSDKLSSLQTHLENIYPVKKSIRKNVNDLEIQTRDEIYKAQDIIESFLSNQTQYEDISSTSLFLQNLQEIVSKIDPIIIKAKNIADSIKEDPQTGDLSPLPPSKSSSRSTRIVGQEEDLELVTGQLLREIAQLQVVPIMGMPGIGKTTLAKSIYDDPRIERRFFTRAWVTVSSEYHVGEIFLKILGSMENMGQKSDVADAMKKLGDRVSQQSEEHLSVHLYQNLFNTRFLIVIDDMWDQGVWDRVRKSFPDNKNGSRILLTTRIAKVADYAKSSDFRHVMSPLSLENSWTLLCDRVFGGANCPPQLVDIGRKIAKNCGGLPLSITVVGGQLSQERKTVEYWKIVEEDINAATANSEEPYLEILSLSYNHLPGRLKGCFLYMGAFPEDSEIIVSKLVKLWVAEGFLRPPTARPDGLEQVAEQYLNDLIDRNLILVRKFSSDRQIKSCGIHDSLRDLAVKESRDERFFHSINRYVQELSEGTKNQRRLSVHKNILMCMEDVYYCAKNVTLARTLVYAGPHHHHPMPFCLTFDLLRVLDALTVFFIEFPNEVVKLIHLRYLSFTYNRKLPPSLSRLRNLQILIVRRHPKNIILGTSILPVEIWNMPQLRHLVFTESRLPDFSNTSYVIFENLQSLSNVDASCCTERVLQNMPNLKRLGLWIEGPGSIQFCIDRLRQLEAFKFTVLNPVPGEKIDFLPKLVFPTTIKKLSLSGCGIAWEDMTIIGQLPFLEVLKLREFAFQGAEWYPEADEFRELKFLLLESLDLEYWEADDSHFPSLARLIINHCYDLEGIPSDIGHIGGLELIELVDCSPSAVESARKIKKEQRDLKKGFQVRIYSSWE